MILKVIQDPKFADAIIVAVFDSAKDTAGANLVNLLIDAKKQNPKLEDRLLGVAAKADAGNAAFSNTQKFVAQKLVKCGLGIYAIVNPNPDTQYSGLANVYGTTDLNEQSGIDSIKADETLWNFDIAESVELNYWKSKLNNNNLNLYGIATTRNKIKKEFLSNLGDNLSKIQELVEKERDSVLFELKSFPFVSISPEDDFGIKVGHRGDLRNTYETIRSSYMDKLRREFNSLRFGLFLSKPPHLPSTHTSPNKPSFASSFGNSAVTNVPPKSNPFCDLPSISTISELEKIFESKMRVVLEFSIKYPYTGQCMIFDTNYFETIFFETFTNCLVEGLKTYFQNEKSLIDNIIKKWGSIGEDYKATLEKGLVESIIFNLEHAITAVGDQVELKRLELISKLKYSQEKLESMNNLKKKYKSLEEATNLVHICKMQSNKLV